MSLGLTDEKSTLDQVMAWCRHATSHYLNQRWLRYLAPYGVTRPQWVNFPTKYLWGICVNLYPKATKHNNVRIIVDLLGSTASKARIIFTDTIDTCIYQWPVFPMQTNRANAPWLVQLHTIIRGIARTVCCQKLWLVYPIFFKKTASEVKNNNPKCSCSKQPGSVSVAPFTNLGSIQHW